MRSGGERRTYVSACGTDDTVDDGSPGWDETRTRSDGNEASNNARAETDSGPLALKTVIENTPCDTTNTGSQVGDNSGHNSAHVSSQSGTSVETEPSNPQEDGTDDNVGDVVWAVVQLVSTVTTTLAQHDGVGERSASGGDMHGGSTSKVKATHLEHPAGCVPCPAGNWVVDNGCPDEHENDL